MMTRINYGLHVSDGWQAPFETVIKSAGYNFLCAKRHFECAFANKPEVFHNGKWVATSSESIKGKLWHIVLGSVQLIPVIGHIVAVVERFFGKKESLPIIESESPRKNEQSQPEVDQTLAKNEAEKQDNAAAAKNAEEKQNNVAATKNAEEKQNNVAATKNDEAQAKVDVDVINEFFSDPDYKMLTDQEYRLKEIENIKNQAQQRIKGGGSNIGSVEEMFSFGRLQDLQGEKGNAEKCFILIFSKQESFKDNARKVKEIFDCLEKKLNSMQLKVKGLNKEVNHSTLDQQQKINAFLNKFGSHISWMRGTCQTFYDIQATDLPLEEKRINFMI